MLSICVIDMFQAVRYIHVRAMPYVMYVHVCTVIYHVHTAINRLTEKLQFMDVSCSPSAVKFKNGQLVLLPSSLAS